KRSKKGLMTQTVAVGSPREPFAPSSIAWHRMLLWMALISYAFVPWLLTEGWKRSPILAGLALAWSLVGPAMAWVSFRHGQESHIDRPATVIEAIAAVVTPPF